MDCKGFDDVLLDLLYEWEDGARHQQSEASRHVEGCARCSALLTQMRQTRAELAVPMLPVPAGLEARILAAARRAEVDERPGWLQAMDHFISRAGSYAMRPQLAMGTLLMLMVGSSFLLLRARPGGPGSVRVTERGVPVFDDRAEAAAPAAAMAPPLDRKAAPETRAGARKPDDAHDGPPRDRDAKTADPSPKGDEPEPAPTPAATATATAEAVASAPTPAAPPQDAGFATAMDDFKARRFGDAARGFAMVESGGGSQAPSAALYGARSIRFGQGCGAAVSRFDGVAARFPGTSIAAEAQWDSATCYREIGQVDRARQIFQTLRHTAGYRDRAENELKALDAAKP